MRSKGHEDLINSDYSHNHEFLVKSSELAPVNFIKEGYAYYA
jgi:hypothetical protein